MTTLETKISKLLILVWTQEAQTKIKCMWNTPFSDRISEEEIPLFITMLRKKPNGEEKVLWNSLTFLKHHYKPLSIKTLYHYPRKINTIITLFSLKLKMFFHAMMSLMKKIEPKFMFIDSTKLMEKMPKYLISNPLMNGLYHPRMYQSLLKMPMILKDTMEKDIHSLNLSLQLGSILLRKKRKTTFKN